MATNKQLHVIYVPGLGDTTVTFQQKVVNSWRFWGVQPELFQMIWADDEAWQLKFDRLLARIDQLAQDGNSIGLVGASAGAGAVINAFAARKDSIVGVVCVAGKVNNPEKIGGKFKSRNPAFVTSAYQVEKSLRKLKPTDRKRILSRYAPLDEVVPLPDSKIPGAKNRLSPTIGHVITISLQLLLGAPSFLRFLKRLQKAKG